MKPGDRVTRVSLRTFRIHDPAEGTIGERGTIERRYEDGGRAYGYTVIWDAAPDHAQYVAPARIRLFADSLTPRPATVLAEQEDRPTVGPVIHVGEKTFTATVAKQEGDKS